MEKRGMNRVDNRLKPLLKQALENRVFSGVAVGVYQYRSREEQGLLSVLGKTRYDEKGTIITRDTFFDLASLTKPLCTALCILCLIEQKKIDWRTRIAEVLPYFFLPEYKSLEVEQLLSHSAGLIAYKPVYQTLPPAIRKENSKELIQTLLREPLASAPGTSCVYSDIGFILLGALIEAVSGKGLDQFFRSEITAPLQIENAVLFRPVTLSLPGQENSAATEQCPWRQRMLQGEAHDEHAWLMNGVAGHAGLFGTITGVMVLTEHLLHQWQGRATHPGFSNQLLQKALNRTYPGHSWCRGFDTPAAQGSSAGDYFSPGSVGHLGYTGTSFWIDPERNIVVVLLTNRVHPTRSNEQIKQFRPLLHNTVLAALRE